MNEGYISIDQATEYTSLTGSTLERFIEAGYLKSISNGSDKMISCGDLESTFGVSIPASETMQEELTEVKVEPIKAEEQSLRDQITVEEIKPEPIESTPTPTPSSGNDVFQKVVEFQEKLLDEKDATIREQSNEINWLRTRIEKLEEQSEKDKILLLSGNQTINKLIDVQKKTNPLKRALSWFGGEEKKQDNKEQEIV